MSGTDDLVGSEGSGTILQRKGRLVHREELGGGQGTVSGSLDVFLYIENNHK